MTVIYPWIGPALAISLLGFGLFGFFRGLALPPNKPEHRAKGNKGTWWRT